MGLLVWTALAMVTMLSSAAAQAEEPPGGNSTSVMAFYYLWYGNPATDGRWLHWNHSVLPHWTEAVNQRYADRIGRPVAAPPAGVHARFYPRRGPYSCADPATLAAQMAELRRAGVGAVVLSWWGRPELSAGDSQGVVTDDRIAGVLEAAGAAGLRVAWHLEPYHGRSAQSVRGDVAYLAASYGAHPALLRQPLLARGSRPGATGPVYFMYDSYHIPAADWRALLGPGGGGERAEAAEPDRGPPPVSVRGTALDASFIGLWLDRGHGADLLEGGFDGAYTYFASDGFSWGASTRNWAAIRSWATQHAKLFVASVGPGYNDEGIRPWNTANTKPREGGEYYRRFWARAMDVDSSPTLGARERGLGARAADIVSITSYNEWGEGTQIEPALRKAGYEDYEDAGGVESYLDMTAELSAQFRQLARVEGAGERSELRR
jgi:glycoprotein endo-alpha-1,2-mannosidase